MATALLLTGCSSKRQDSHFEVKGVEAKWSNGRMDVSSRQKLTLSNEARDALIHGVPLSLELEFLLRNTSSQTRVGNTTSHYEIRYLPLSTHYQLSISGKPGVKTYPRLRHVLADLSRTEVSLETGVLPAGDYELMARIRLDQRSMPPPMRLPVLLSSSWRHDSSWSSWPLQIQPEA